MKKLLILFLLSFNLSATSADRYHFCSNQDLTLTFAESSFLDEPIINFMHTKMLTINGANIEIRMESANTDILVSAISEDEENPMMLYFVAQRPKDLSQEFDYYGTTVRIFNITNNAENSVIMKCSSKKVQIWPVDMARL